MKYFILDGNFPPEMPLGINFDAALAEHHAYIHGFVTRGDVLFGGPKPSGGGVIVLRCNDEAEAQKIAREDPFTLAGVQFYDVIEFSKFTGQDFVDGWFV